MSLLQHKELNLGENNNIRTLNKNDNGNHGKRKLIEQSGHNISEKFKIEWVFWRNYLQQPFHWVALYSCISQCKCLQDKGSVTVNKSMKPLPSTLLKIMQLIKIHKSNLKCLKSWKHTE